MRGFTVSGSSARVCKSSRRQSRAEGAAIQITGTPGSTRPSKSKTSRPVGEEKGEAGSKRVRGVIGDLEQHGERTCNGTLEGDPRRKPPFAMTATPEEPTSCMRR